MPTRIPSVHTIAVVAVSFSWCVSEVGLASRPVPVVRDQCSRRTIDRELAFGSCAPLRCSRVPLPVDFESFWRESEVEACGRLEAGVIDYTDYAGVETVPIRSDRLYSSLSNAPGRGRVELDSDSKLRVEDCTSGRTGMVGQSTRTTEQSGGYLAFAPFVLLHDSTGSRRRWQVGRSFAFAVWILGPCWHSELERLSCAMVRICRQRSDRLCATRRSDWRRFVPLQYDFQVLAMCSRWSARMSFLDLVAPYIMQDSALTFWSPRSSFYGESIETPNNVAILAK